MKTTPSHDFFQPENSYHFSEDAIFLSDFVGQQCLNAWQKKAKNTPILLLDLGCGCGVLGLLSLVYFHKHIPNIAAHVRILGVDRSPELIHAAKQNAQHYDNQYHTLCGNIFDAEIQKQIQVWAYSQMRDDSHTNCGVTKNPRLFDGVITNPPWYNENHGINSKHPLRRQALFGHENCLSQFFLIAQNVLKKNASLYTIGKSQHFSKYVMPPHLLPVTIQHVHASAHENATFFLMEAKFQSQAETKILKPLFIQK